MPDIVLGVDIREACKDHDWTYSANSYISKHEADIAFMRDIYRILIAAGVADDDAAYAAFTYYIGVYEFFGGLL
ncbi:MAG: hypothetical protein ABL909_05060 [Sphingopyxis sp.]